MNSTKIGLYFLRLKFDRKYFPLVPSLERILSIQTAKEVLLSSELFVWLVGKNGTSQKHRESKYQTFEIYAACSVHDRGTLCVQADKERPTLSHVEAIPYRETLPWYVANCYRKDQKDRKGTACRFEGIAGRNGIAGETILGRPDSRIVLRSVRRRCANVSAFCG